MPLDTSQHRRWVRFVALIVMLFAASACQSGDEPTEIPKSPPPGQSLPKVAEAPAAVEPLKDEIPPAELDAVSTAHFRGLGLMEQYEYRKAAEAFRDVRRRAPGWIAGSINLAIALLNDSGAQASEAKKSGDGAAVQSHFDEALGLLQGVLDRDPDNRHAHFCRGIILEQQGALDRAHTHFRRVTELDPNDAAAWYWTASTLTDPADPTQPAGPAQAKEQVELLTKALACDPYLTPAIYKLSFAYRLAGEPAKQKELLDRWREINPDRQQPVPGPGNSAEKVYGEMGRYALGMNPFGPAEAAKFARAAPPKFDRPEPFHVKLADGDRWAGRGDFQGKHAVIDRVRARFGAGVATFDADGDGKTDVYLTSAVIGPKGPRDVLLLNKGDGAFEDASAVFGLSPEQASLGAAAADFDADRRIDLFLTGVGGNRLLRNKDGKGFEDLTASLKNPGPPALSLAARWLDLDQDGDLDLYVVNYTAAEHADKAFIAGQPAPPGLANSVYRNDGQPAAIPGSPAPAWAPLAVAWENVKANQGLSINLVPWTGMEPLLGGVTAHTGVAACDVDGDRDIDLILTADSAPSVAVLNDRLGAFHEVALKDALPIENASGLLTADFDADGRPDLAAPSASGRLQVWRNTTERATAADTQITFEKFAANAENWRAAAAFDMDLDGHVDLLGLSLDAPKWSRNERSRLAAEPLPIGIETPALDGLALVDLAGDALPDLLVLSPGAPPTLARALGNGNNWLGLRLGGHWRVKPELMRTNSHAVGARVLVQGQGIQVAYDHTTPDSGLGQSIGPVVLGLGSRQAAELVHVRWPDGVMQCELNVPCDQSMVLSENNRKTGSCPVLFTWNGERFVCLGDFLGGGGMGYLVAPGVYGQPDRDESVAIAADQLRAEQGAFRISITEPMDEVAYLDKLTLDVVDRPPGASVALDERFAPTGPRPTGGLLAWRRAVEPLKATDLAGRDATETLKHWDRRTVDGFALRNGWIGYAEEHGIVLDFGDRLSGFGPEDRLVLCLAGWVEYPYSQTNYAAATAGVSLKPPVIERQREDGSWQVIEPHAGYPAGLPRMTTLDLTGKLGGGRCVLRIRTNMECYYDQAFVAVRDADAEKALKVTSLPVARAALGHRGYTREISPDGRLPLVYDYDYVDPAPLARMSGRLTRYGDVAKLLQADDDQHCVVGPGDEARIEFAALELPALPDGWTRSYVLRSIGYCKDADPFTAGSDSVEPLPWRGMPDFPFADPKTERPRDPAYERYLREYQTRPAGGPEAKL
ncbi:MAG: FG-GAP-like repeat-containing protein [Paludisphaera borealis]|uniref:FG-GAP-like repeat-containing protein n=1 Tax=Paludisphaera borealis TaxID=1387353 RepID=UPI002843D2B9|nr:FG-GAP-like repeat-containing protein [Paludisphaera borealis]MDR3620260.1 FG-GAP-like repeat-containing protein [Paludisphaera borealis]